MHNTKQIQLQILLCFLAVTLLMCTETPIQYKNSVGPLNISAVLNAAEASIAQNAIGYQKYSFVNGKTQNKSFETVSNSGSLQYFYELDLSAPALKDAYVVGSVMRNDTFIVSFVKKPEVKAPIRWLKASYTNQNELVRITASLLQKNQVFSSEKWVELHFKNRNNTPLCMHTILRGKQGFRFATSDTFFIKTTYQYRPIVP